MEIRFLRQEYLKSTEIYIDFLENRIGLKEEHFDNKSVYINDVPDFPVYMNDSESKVLFFEAFKVIGAKYLKIDCEYIFDGQFWYSLLLLKKREYLLSKYPKIKNSEKDFRNIVLKKFDWENYIYKCVLAVQYTNDHTDDEEKRIDYYETIINNLDIYNYIIKYAIFRNQQFVINILDIIKENNLSGILKSKIKNRPDLGKDERCGRRVIYELNKCYPIILAPTLPKEELEILFLNNLKKYTNYEEKGENKKASLLEKFFSNSKGKRKVI